MISFMTVWYNLPFTILIVFAVLLAALQFVGLGGDADADVDADVSADQDLDIDGADVPPVLTLFAFLGVGKAPLVVVLFLLLGTVGVLGWLMNSITQRVLGTYPDFAFFAVLPLAFIIGGLLSSRAARFIAWMLPPISTTATSSKALVGRRGVVISTKVDKKYGRVQVRDRGGTRISVFAITSDDIAFERSTEVVLISYDPDQKWYIVDRV